MSGFWAVFWLAVVLKLPIVAALLLIWYAVQEPEPQEQPSDGDGGLPRSPHPRPPRHPRPSRRGPHAEPAPPAPRRVRGVVRRRTPARG